MSRIHKDSVTYQDVTNKIARDNDLIINSADAYANPLFQAHMQGNFFRKLRYSKQFTVFRVFLALFFFILPSIVLVVFFWKITDPAWTTETIFMLVVVLSFALLYFLAGLQLLFPRKKD